MTPAPFALNSQRNSPRELVYLIAPAGHPNYGDEFILRTWLRYLARTRPEADVVVDCHTPGQATILFRGCHPRLTFVDTAWRICFRAAEFGAVEAIAFAAEVVDDPGRMPTIVSGIELLARADTVHMVGGGYINTVWAHHVTLPATALAAARRSGGRAVATGQGLLPVGDAERLRLVRELVDGFTVFDVRDEPSARAVPGSARDLSNTGDDAWLGVGDGDVYDAESEAAQRRFVFCLQSDLVDDFAGGQGVDGLTEMVRRVVRQWRISGQDAAFVEGIPGADRVVFDRVADLLPGVVFIPFTDVWARGLPARPEQTWISTRFHHHLLAAAAGASGAALAGRRDYYVVKHHSLRDVGSRWHITDDYDLPETPMRDGGVPPAAVGRLRAGKEALADRLYPQQSSSTLRRAASALGIGRPWA
jgi:polysaccharide pyruvyl transferase WcaK-like protein